MSPAPLTLMVARRVSRGRYADFTAWLEEGRALAADFSGYLGSGVLAPPPGDDEYQIIFRFRDADTLAAWEHSALCDVNYFGRLATIKMAGWVG